MELAFIIWFVGTVPGIAGGMCFVLFMCLAISGTTCIGTKISAMYETCDYDQEQLFAISKFARNIFLVCFPFWFLFLLVPDKTTAYQMLAAYGVQTVAENPKAQEIASDGVDVLQALMKKAKAELEKDTK